MLLQTSYKADVVEHILNTPDSVFEAIGKEKKQILANPDILNWMWISYQKSIEDYGEDATTAFNDAMKDCLGIDVPQDNSSDRANVILTCPHCGGTDFKGGTNLMENPAKDVPLACCSCGKTIAMKDLPINCRVISIG